MVGNQWVIKGSVVLPTTIFDNWQKVKNLNPLLHREYNPQCFDYNNVSILVAEPTNFDFPESVRTEFADFDVELCRLFQDIEDFGNPSRKLKKH